MKRLLSLILVLALCVSVFASCEYLPKFDFDFDLGFGKDNNDDKNDDTNVDDLPPIEEKTDLEKALEYIHQMYKDMAEVTAANYDLITVAPVGDTTYTVTWTVSDERVTIVAKNDTIVTVVIPESNEDFTYVLKATVTGPDGASLSKEYSHKVNKFAYTTFAQYIEAADDDPVVVTGIITGIISKSTGSNSNGFYMQDENNEGGYYVYSFSDKEYDPVTAGLKVGQTVKVKGNKDTYNGTHEVVSAAVEVIDETINLVTPVNYTSILSAATSLSDETLVYKQGMLVTINGVTVLEAGDNGYYYFGLDDHKVYLRISSSANPTDKTSLDAVKAAHAANYGNIATVTGVISIYSGNFYLTPVSADAFSDFQTPERSDLEKAQFEVEALKVTDSLSSDGTLTLPVVGATYENVTIAWTTTSEHLVINGANVTVTIPDTATDVVITATATCGTETATKDFTINLNKSITSIKDAIVIGAAQENKTYTAAKYILSGVITEVQNTKYGNVVITDGTGSILVYGLYNADGTVRYDAMETKPVVGDHITVIGVLGNYNGTPQMQNGWLMSHTAPTTIENAIAVGTAQENKTYTTEKYVLSGVVTEVQNTKYGNVVISDGTNSILVYGLYSADGTVRYDAMEFQPVVGTPITVLGVLGNYNGTPQMQNGWLVSYDPHVHTYETLANKCDTCGEVTEHTCKNDNNTVDAFCDLCGETLEHTCVDADTNSACDLCGKPFTPVAEGETKASLDLLKAGTDNEWNSNTKYLSHSVDQNVTLTFAGGNNTGKFYSDGIRLYATDSPAATITVSVAEGYELVSIKFVTLTGTYAFICSGSDTTTDLSNTVISVSGSTVTFNTVKNGTDGKQVRLQSVEVVYKAVEKAEA